MPKLISKKIQIVDDDGNEYDQVKIDAYLDTEWKRRWLDVLLLSVCSLMVGFVVGKTVTIMGWF